jgi:hypothetical protein
MDAARPRPGPRAAPTRAAAPPAATPAPRPAAAGAGASPTRYQQLFKTVEAQQYALQSAMLGVLQRVERGEGPTGSALPSFAADMFTGFRQGGQGNCVTVAAIKAAMTRFGTGGVFKGVRFDDAGNAQIWMRDGFRMNLSAQERALAARASGFSGRDPRLLSYAQFYYAAAAKRAQLSGNDGLRGMSYGQALRSLNDGEFTDEGLRWLGLSQHIRPISAHWGNVARYTAVVGSNSGHAMFVSRGWVERYGQASGGQWGIFKTYALE